MTLDRMLDELARRDLRFVLVGGFAAIAHGSSYLTNDLDICYDTAEDNVTRFVELLLEWQACPRGWDPGLPWILDLKTFRTTPILTLRTREGDIDLLDRVEGVGDYAACLAASDEFSIGTEKVHILSLDALIQAKKATARTKDREHVIALEALRALRDG